MKTIKTALAYVLLLAMLLSSFGGYALGAADTTVSVDKQLVFDPLAGAQSVAYERHEDGYDVSLDRDADGVTMRVAAVPDATAADKASLYIRTGVMLKAGKTYRVSYTLASEQALDGYTVCFDGAEENAYGSAETRSVSAGGADLARFLLTCEAESGELILRLLLGRTPVNTLRLSDLAVEEATEEEIAAGTDTVLVDKLNLNAPGSVSMWTNDDCKAKLTAEGETATLTVTEVPASGAEVWKIKLFVHTGVMPEAGKTYRFHADVNASAGGIVEICYNEGDVEKGYAVLYNQRLYSGKQTMGRLIYIPTEKENAGELVFQLSLGKLKKGDTVTIGNIGVDEMIPTYKNALADDFAFNKTWEYTSYDPDSLDISSTSPVPTAISWDGSGAVTGSGDRAGALVVSGGTAKLEINGGFDVWDARLNLDTGMSLTKDTTYQVSFKIRSTAAYSNYEVLYGTALNGVDNNQAYGSLKGRSLAADTEDTVSYVLKPNADGGLLVSLQLGALGGGSATVTVSDLKLAEMSEGTPTAVSASVEYPSGAPTNGSFENRDGRGALSGDGFSAVYTRDDNAKDEWQCGLFVNGVCGVKAGRQYLVSYEIEADSNVHYKLTYHHDNKWADDGEDGMYWRYTGDGGCTDVITPSADGSLTLRLNLGEAPAGTKITVSGVEVTEQVSDVDYPTSADDKGSFENRDGRGALNGNGTSAVYTRDDNANDGWQCGLFANSICAVEAGQKYLVSYDVAADSNAHYKLTYHHDNKWAADGEDGVYWRYTDNGGCTDVITPSADGNLTLRFDLGEADAGTDITLSNITVAKQVSDVTYPTAVDPGSFENRDGRGALDGNGTSVVYTRDDNADNDWQCGLFVNSVCDVVGGKKYIVSYDIQSDRDETKFFAVNYNHSDDRKCEQDDGRGEHDVTNTKTTFTDECTATGDGRLYLRFDLGSVSVGAKITVSNITVKEVPLVAGDPVPVSYGSVWTETYDGFTAPLTKYGDRVVMDVTKPAGTDPATWRAKLCIRTGVTYEARKSYRVLFDIEAAQSQSEFCVITKGVSNSEDVRGTWGQTLSAGQKKTIATRPIPAGKGSGALDIDIELGKLNGNANTYTVSNVRVEEVVGEMAVRESKLTGAVENDMQNGYTAPLKRAKDSATVSIDRTPATGMEAWKSKLFVNTDVSVSEGETYRVCMDVLAENDMGYEVCYNCGGVEKGFDAVYDLRAAGGKTQTIERLFTAGRSGTLTLQLSLGNVPAPNAVTVSNVTVEKATYTSGGSALPEPLTFRGSSAVSYWAHADYTTKLTGTDDAITMHVLKAPGFGAEPWKIKLFLDTETPLEAGKCYRVTTELLAKSPQNVEICYNNGGAEMGYDAMGGIRLAAGVGQTVEKLVAVPADKADLKNLMLQINLGAATSPNEITVSGVTVEEVSLQYASLMAQNYNYQNRSDVWTKPDFAAKLDATRDNATICITDAPQTGAEVWKAKLFVHTGVVLSAGKSYVVRADLVSDKDLTYEVCFNNEETEKGFDVLYGQFARANATAAIDKKISVPASMTDAGELVLQFSVGGPGANNVTVANVSVQEIRYGTNGAKSLAPAAAIAQQGALDLSVTREALSGRLNGAGGAIRVAGVELCAGEQYEAAFTGRADTALTGTLTLRKAGASAPAMTRRFELSGEAKPFAFTTAEPLSEGGTYELLWQFDGAANGATAELSDVAVSLPAEQLVVKRSDQKVTVNGAAVTPDAYNINGYNYFKLRDLALLLNDTDAQFVVRYNTQNHTVSLTTGKRYVPVGGELVRGNDRSASCTRGIQELLVNSAPVRLKAYNLGNNNYFKLRDLGDILGFRTDYIEETDTAAITSPLTPEAQEASYAYDTFFRPEIDGESQPYVGDPMAFYENGTYYIYYLKEGGDSVNHSVYLTTTTDFASYTEYDKPVLSASRGDAQDSWIGTGSVTKVDGTYYFFYTGFNSSGAQEYHEKIMVAKSSDLTSFEKVSGWDITPPASLGQKNDFRDPQAYYDPATDTISLTVTASQGGVARILKYTLDKNLQNARYDGIIFTDPTGKYWNLECSDTFQIGNKWYLTYSAQEDTLWYATADSRFGPYSEPVQLDGRVFYAAKHVDNGKDAYMVGWARRSESASSTQEVAGWGGNLTVQKLAQRADGSLALVPVDSIAAGFRTPKAVEAERISLTADSDYSFRPVCTGEESFMLTGEFTYTGSGSFGLAFDFNGSESSYKLVSVNPGENTLSLAFNEGVTKIAETPAKLGGKHSFTYIQDGSVGIFYVDQTASLVVRVYGSTGKPVYLFAQDNSVIFTSLKCFTK